MDQSNYPWTNIFGWDFSRLGSDAPCIGTNETWKQSAWESLSMCGVFSALQENTISHSFASFPGPKLVYILYLSFFFFYKKYSLSFIATWLQSLKELIVPASSCYWNLNKQIMLDGLFGWVFCRHLLEFGVVFAMEIGFFRCNRWLFWCGKV